MSYNYFKNGVLNLIAGKHPTDKALSATSNHPVANRILKAKFDEIVTALSNKQDKLTNPLTKSDVVDNVTSSTTNVPLSANQGRVLNNNKCDKAYIPLYGTSTYSRGPIKDALQVDLAKAESQSNKCGYVYVGYSTAMPSNCNSGIREVFYYNNTEVMIKITGVTTSGVAGVWINAYYGSTWTGWRELNTTAR